MGYLVYVTIRNVLKDIRRKPLHCAQILVAYIPTSKLEGLGKTASVATAQADVFEKSVIENRIK